MVKVRQEGHCSQDNADQGEDDGDNATIAQRVEVEENCGQEVAQCQNSHACNQTKHNLVELRSDLNRADLVNNEHADEDAKFPTFDPNDVVKAFSALGFTGMTSRLARMAGGSAAGAVAQTASATPALPIPSEYLQAGDASAALTAALENQEWIGVRRRILGNANPLLDLKSSGQSSRCVSCLQIL